MSTLDRTETESSGCNLNSDEIREATRLENQLCFPIYSASRLITQAYAPYLEKMGITYPQYLVLMVLWNQDGQTVNEIGEKLFLDSGTITPVLQRLAAMGLVQRKRSEHDDRKVQNFLTEAGAKMRTPAAQMGFQLFCASGLSIDEIGILKTAMTDLVDRVRRHLSERN